MQAQFDGVLHSALSGLNHDEARFNELLVPVKGSSRGVLRRARTASRKKDVRGSCCAGRLADGLQVQVSRDDLTERLVTTSRLAASSPQQLFELPPRAQQLRPVR